MTAISFKTLIKEGTVKRGDLLRVAHADLQTERGFNLRMPGPDLDAHIDALTNHIMQGGEVPPLEVRIADDGRILIVDGHCRHAAFGRAIQQGAPIEYIDVMPFRGNDADRVARIISSAAGRPLTPLETALGYKRLAAFKLTSDDIAAKFSKTRQHVDQLLILANANADVHQLVADGAVAATVAIDAVRKHGEGAGAFLGEQLDKAKAGGKRKVTAGVVNGKKLPAKATAAAVSAVDWFIAEVPQEELRKLEHAKDGTTDSAGTVAVPITSLLCLLSAHDELMAARETSAKKERERQAKVAQQELPQ